MFLYNMYFSSKDCPVSPPAVYNMQFPENSISFVSQPSSSNSSNSTTPMQFRGYVKRPAKDQACGVFTVDLSQMRSLRLFFRCVSSFVDSRYCLSILKVLCFAFSEITDRMYSLGTLLFFLPFVIASSC